MHWNICRILGFYRAPPVVGRNVNLEDEIEPIADKKLLDTFFKKGKIPLKSLVTVTYTFVFLEIVL